jgi:hypothetical protein
MKDTWVHESEFTAHGFCPTRTSCPCCASALPTHCSGRCAAAPAAVQHRVTMIIARGVTTVIRLTETGSSSLWSSLGEWHHVLSTAPPWQSSGRVAPAPLRAAGRSSAAARSTSVSTSSFQLVPRHCDKRHGSVPQLVTRHCDKRHGSVPQLVPRHCDKWEPWEWWAS